MSLLLGIDIGTGSSKGVLVEPDGRVLARAQVPHEISRPRRGWAEMDPEAQWWGDFVTLCRELIPQRDGRAIAGLGVSGIGPCVVQADPDFVPTGPAILYGIDSRAADQVERLERRFGEAAVLQRGGSVLSSQAAGPKLLWLTEQDGWRSGARWYSAHSYLIDRLTGEWVLDRHTASQFDPFYDVETDDWAHDWVSDVLPGVGLPRLAWSDEVVGEVSPRAAAETGLPAGLPVVAGAVDAWAEAYSVGVRRPGDAMLMYGTTMFYVEVVSDPAWRSDTIWRTAGWRADAPTRAAGISSGGALASWVRDLSGVPWGELTERAGRLPAGADGLCMLPYFDGERSPVFDPSARGVVVGLTLAHTAPHLLRAAYESVALGVRSILEHDSSAALPSRLVAVGGGTTGGLWPQVLSDVTGLAQEIPRVTVGAAYGDALLAAVGIGLVPADTDWAHIDATLTPSPQTRETYDRLYEDVYRGLYASTLDATRTLTALSR